MKLQKHEVELLTLVAQHGPCAASVIHEETDNKTLQETITDLGHLNNHGYVSGKGRIYQLTTKGKAFVLQSDDIEEVIEINNCVDSALGELEKQLAVKPIELVPVSRFEKKCEVLDKLSLILDPSIADYLDDIKADVIQLHEKAA